MIKNKKFNLLNITKGSLSVAALFFPVILSSNNASATPVKNPGVKVNISGTPGYMKNYAKITTPSSGYISLVSGKPSKGSPLTPVGPTEARLRMLVKIFEETGQAVVTTGALGSVQFKSQPPGSGQGSSGTITVKTGSGKIIKTINQNSGPKVGNFPIIPQDGN